MPNKRLHDCNDLIQTVKLGYSSRRLCIPRFLVSDLMHFIVHTLYPIPTHSEQLFARFKPLILGRIIVVSHQSNSTFHCIGTQLSLVRVM